jgi:hypothetical protein
MRQPSSGITKRATKALPFNVGRTSCSDRALVIRSRTETQLDVMSACGTAPSKDRSTLPTKRSGFAGRAPRSGPTVDEPLAPGQRHAIATARAPFAAACKAPSGAARSGGGTMEGAGDVAAGAGRGVAGGSAFLDASFA